MPSFLGRHISLTQWGTAAMAVLGTLLLCNDGSPPNVGDAWALGAAGLSAVIILCTEISMRVCESKVRETCIGRPSLETGPWSPCATWVP